MGIDGEPIKNSTGNKNKVLSGDRETIKTDSSFSFLSIWNNNRARK